MILRLLFFLIFLIPVCAKAQNFIHQNVRVSADTKVVDAISGEVYSKEEAAEFREKGIGEFWPVYDKYGDVEYLKYYADKRTEPLRSMEKRVKPKEVFPPFVMESVNGKIFDSEKLKDRYLILQFQAALIKPFYDEQKAREFNKAAEILSKEYALTALLISSADKDRMLQHYRIENSVFQLIPSGGAFFQRYHIIKMPSIVLIAPGNRLIAYLANPTADEIVEAVRSYH